MNINGRKISSKLLLTLIFTAIFFSVTLNSPANYSSFTRFCKILALGQDTTKPRIRHPKDAGRKGSSIAGDTVRPGSPRITGDTLRRDSLGIAAAMAPMLMVRWRAWVAQPRGES